MYDWVASDSAEVEKIEIVFNLTKLQRQNFNDKFVTIFDCLCDERSLNEPRNQLSLIFQVSVNGFIGDVKTSWDLFDRKWKCQFENESGKNATSAVDYIAGQQYEAPYSDTLSYSPGTFICYLESKIRRCPERAILVFGDQYPITNSFKGSI